MSVRIIIVLLALPLFLLLAAVNSLLLYREDTADMEAGLRNEALAAAVTVAEFTRASPDPSGDLAEPRRLAALHHVDREITGLDTLYLVRPGRPALSLHIGPIGQVRQGPAPAEAHVLGTWEDARGSHLITALAPVGRGMMVVADIDAEPLARRAFHLKRLSIALIVGSAFLAILIGLVSARRVIGEFRRTRSIIEAHGDRDHDAPLAIREVRDLADAVHMIDTNVASELQRLGGHSEGDPAIGIAATRAKYFPDISESHDGLALSIRTLPNAPAGCFHIRRAIEGGFILILGQTEGEPAEALAAAIALKAYILAGPPDAFDERVSTAGRLFGLKVVNTSVWATWSPRPLAIGLHGNAIAMGQYGQSNPGLDPDELTQDLSALFPDAGIVAAASASSQDEKTVSA